MATKLGRKELPAGHGPADFKYVGNPAREQGGFGPGVGIADMACVNQFGEANNSKYYHAGIVQSTKGAGFFVYLEWGRIVGANKSWNGSFAGGDYQFVRCDSEADARDFFSKQCASKNVKRLTQRNVDGKVIWTARDGEDGYLVQRLATRVRGLPDAYAIKDDTGVAPKAAPAPFAPSEAKAKKAAAPAKSFHPAVVKLAQDLVGGVKTYTRALSAATGIVPTMDAIKEVRDELVPLALNRIKAVGDDVRAQVRDADLVGISKLVASLVPRDIPRGGISEEEAILSASNILRLQMDLDAFESALGSESFDSAAPSTTVDPDALLNATLTWLDPRGSEGIWVLKTFAGMDNHKHSNFRGARVINVFGVSRPDRDARFVAAVNELASRRKGQHLGDVRPGLQPHSRPDLSDVSDVAAGANIFLGIHGTRGVNVSPIMAGHFRLPKSLSGVHISGAAFGHGVYFATAAGKSANYCGTRSSAYGAGGNVNGRGFFMFLCDVAGGKFHYPRAAWQISDRCPDGADTVFAHPSRCPTLENDEHVIFNPNLARIRYLVELTF